MATSQTRSDLDLVASYNSAATLYAFVTTSAPDLTTTANGTAVEPTTAQWVGYADQAVVANTTNFGTPTGGTMTLAVPITFPVAGTGSVDNTPLTHFGFRTAAGGGYIVDVIPLPSGTVIKTGYGLIIQAGTNVVER